jgi:hypothetical protein
MQIARFADPADRKIAKSFIDTPTYRRATFIRSPQFREAKAYAIVHNADVVVADIQELLRRTPAGEIQDCVAVLDSPEVEIYDASLRSTWSSLSISRRQEIMVNSIRERGSRSEAVKVGLSLGKKEHRASKGNGLKGSHANKVKADNRAKRLSEVVRAEEQKLAPGAPLSPSALAKVLNEAGELSPMGGKWSHNSAKNLIARLRQLWR